MRIKKYKRNPVIVEAIQLDNTPQSICAVYDFIYKTNLSSGHTDVTSIVNNTIKDGGIVIPILGDKLFATFGDYVIKDEQGDYLISSEEKFEKDYF